MKLTEKLHAVCVIKTDDILCRSYSLTIENGKITDVAQLTRSDDLPAVSIGLAQRHLWYQMRNNKEIPHAKSSKNSEI
jgi:hypothetical protein